MQKHVSKPANLHGVKRVSAARNPFPVCLHLACTNQHPGHTRTGMHAASQAPAPCSCTYSRPLPIGLRDSSPAAHSA